MVNTPFAREPFVSATDKLTGLLAVPFDLLECAWPQPVESDANRWLSPPAWNAPLMPYRPQPRWDLVEHMPVWTIDWQAFFRHLVQPWRLWKDAGQMRGFQIHFRIVMRDSGQLAIWSEDGCIVRKGETVLIEDRAAHGPVRHIVDVTLGDTLDVALCQLSGGWVWGAGFIPPFVSAEDAAEILEPFLNLVMTRLRKAGGPPIKMFTDGRYPYRAVVTAYSMILNGYSPREIFLYGDYQWSAGARACFERLLPFATIVPTVDVCERLERLGGTELSTLALRYWYVMKACVMVLETPDEFCAIDDDVFVLDDVDDALRAFQTNDYVFLPEDDFAGEYHRLWHRAIPRPSPIGTGRANIGLSWQRQVHERQTIAEAIVEVSPDRARAAGEFSDGKVWFWEQGLINMLYADRPHLMLARQRYPYIHTDGLPGGMLGYDYATNPCQFAAVHFAGGRFGRPTDLVSLALAPAILRRDSLPARQDAR